MKYFLTIIVAMLTFSVGARAQCTMPSALCAYSGVDVIPATPVPNFSSSQNGIQNNAILFDTSFLGHLNLDGVTKFTNAANLSPTTRVTDAASAAGSTRPNFTAGLGGSAAFVLTSLSLDKTTGGGWIRIDKMSTGMVCLFNTLVFPGHCQPASAYTNLNGKNPASGIFLTTNMCNVNSGCFAGTSNQAQDFGQFSFSLTINDLLYTQGGNSYDITQYTAPVISATGVTPYRFSRAAGSVGVYTKEPTIVDFEFGIPVGQNAPAWQPNTNYSFGQYVNVLLASSEMLNGGVWKAGMTVKAGDIIRSGTCMYKAITPGTTGLTQPLLSRIVSKIKTVMGIKTSLSSPAFPTSACKNNTYPDGTVTWRGTFSDVSFVYQKTSAGTQTSGATFMVTGHPDLATTVTDNGMVWANSGPNYIPQSNGQMWTAIGGTSRDMDYPGTNYARYYTIGCSTNTYGSAAVGYNNYNASQGSGVCVSEYDALLNVFHYLNTVTGIWTDWTCTNGIGYKCTGGTWKGITVGALTAIANPLGTGQLCSFEIHNAKMSKNGLYVLIVAVGRTPACSKTQNFYLWKTTTAAYNSISSLRTTYGGMNHWDILTNKMVAFNSGALAFGTCKPFCYTNGVLNTIYDLTGDVSQQSNVTFGTSLNSYFNTAPRMANTNTPQSNPNGCYVTNNGVQQNPDCNLSELLDSHLSGADDNGMDTYPLCGTTYNYATLGPATNAFQGIETCYSINPNYLASALPATKGFVWQFTHTWATGTSLTFSTQFQISQLSQDGKWLFWSSDRGCQDGSSTGQGPTVWVSGTRVGFLAIAAVPANPSSLCGYPWIAKHGYAVGNLIDPIEGTNGSGQVDSVFQAIYVNGTSGPQSTLNGGQPICGTVSCFATAKAPTATLAGDTVCDNQNWNGTTQLNSLNPTLPYSVSCPNGTVWQSLGKQNQRGDVYAVNLAGFNSGPVQPINAPTGLTSKVN